MSFRSIFPLALLVLAGGCASGGKEPPSLAPRAAEKIDPRLPIVDRSGELPADPALAAALADARRTAAEAARQVDPAIASARSAAAGAGAKGSESWITAQQLLSVAVAARAPFTKALGDFDRLISERIQRGSRLVPRDLEIARSVAADLAALDQRQGSELDALERQLRR